MNREFIIEWVDGGREPNEPPDPAFPYGIDVIFGKPGQPTCDTVLPYPAKRCGLYRVVCRLCAVSVGVTTAGRPDDPRSLHLACPFADLS